MVVAAKSSATIVQRTLDRGAEPGSSAGSDAAERAETAIDGKDDSGDEGGRIAAKPLHSGVELIGATEATHRRVRDDGRRSSGVAAIGIQEDRPVLLGNEEPGRDRVDSKTVAVLS